MKNTLKKIMCLVLVVCMLVSVGVALASCGGPTGEGQYTYNSWSTALGTNWNPHTWDTNADDSILGYLSSPFVTIEALDTEEGLYQWAYEMATSITDVTAANKSDLTKYDVTLPAGKTADQVTSGYVFEIKLNPDAKWETGEKITADDYIESMKDLLDSKMRNYRANLYYSGESAVAGGLEYYNSGAPIYDPTVVYNPDRTEVAPEDAKVYISLTAENMTMASYSFTFMLSYYVEQELYDALAETANPYGMIEVTEENWDTVITICDQYLMAFGANLLEWGYIEDAEGDYVWDATAEKYVKVEEGQTGTHRYDYILDDDGNKKLLNENDIEEFFFYHNGFGEEVEYDETVGCYKVDDYTIRYVCETAIDFNYFLTSCTSTWLVHQETYDSLKKEENGLTVTTYGTSMASTVSYGVYKMTNYEDMKQVVFERNENWYGWDKDADGNLVKDEDGNLVSTTKFKVDGEYKKQYLTTKIVIDVMTEEVAKQKFFKGELMDYSPSSEELSSYVTSDRLYTVDETYTMSFFFHTNLEKLQEMDEGANNNSVVLSNDNFRKAMSLAIDRADYVTVTQAWTPAFSLMNHLYHYDIYNDPTSSYRKSDAAMQAIVNLYGVEYGEGTDYATLKEAHDAITGYNLTEAKALMAQACDELVEAGLYTEGEDIKIQIGWAKGALTADDNNQVAKLNEYVNAALAGSGFGTITFEAIGNIDDRYGDVASGVYAIGYGAWGGAAFYPFKNLQVYTDPNQYDINEAGCWNPLTETLTLTVPGVDEEGNAIEESVTMTWYEWGNSMVGVGPYANADMETKLIITAQLEEKFLAKYYRIPLAVTTVCSILSYKVDEYCDNYNIMYGFGGFRLMSYNYDDAEWNAYVAEQGGELDYH